MTTDAELDAILERARDSRNVAEGSAQPLSELIASLRSDDVRAEAEKSRRSKAAGVRWKLLVPAVAVLVVLPVGATAVASLSAHTGEYGDPDTSTEVNDRSEWLGLSADDAPAVIVDLYDPAVPLPEGAVASDVINPVAQTLAKMGIVPDGESGAVATQESTVKTLFEKAARCLWYREWLEADSDDSVTRLGAATEGIAASATWPATVASDGGGVVDTIVVIGQSAASGDRNAMLGAYAPCVSYYGAASK